MKPIFVALSLTLAFCLPLSAQDQPAPPPEKQEEPEKPKPEEKKAEPGEAVTTTHKGTFFGKEITYDATAGNIPLKKDDGTVRANVFYIAYTLKDNPDPGKRPITFCFNGGPGSSSVWLHLGAFGPKRVDIPAEGTGFPVAPFSLIDNPDSLLAETDLVFIDPVSTGFSRPEKAEPKEFYNFDGDIQAVADFIRLYVTRNARWGSPKFLAGESYGAIRACGLTAPLQSRQGMYLNGIILVSGLLDFSTLSGGDLSHIVYLPSMTAVAHFHKKLAPDLQQDLVKTVELSRAFANGPYAAALHRGDELDDATKQKVAEEMARLTGLTKEEILLSQLRPGPTKFRKIITEKRTSHHRPLRWAGSRRRTKPRWSLAVFRSIPR
jgi:carboxypeptidase C (cathepsin A)